MRLSIRVLPAFFLFLSTPAPGQTATAGQEVPTQPQISATGRGEVRVKPTRAVIVFTVQGRGETAAAAATENARLVAATIRSLSSAGAKSEDVSNPGYNVAPDYEYTPTGRKQNGFVANNSIRVEIPKIADVGKIIDAGLAGGASMVGSTQFLGDKMEDSRRAALKLAVQAAKDDAEIMADAAGGRLGRLLSVTGGGVSGPVQGGMLREAMAGGMVASSSVPTSIALPDLTVVSTATARWEFIPRK